MVADIVNNVSLWVGGPRPHAEGMKVAYLLYPRFSALDVVGPFQVLCAAPGVQSVFVAAEAGAVVDDTGLCALWAGTTLADVASADVVVVPGRDCSRDPDAASVARLRVVHPTTAWTLSVGTGSSYLAASGALEGATAEYDPQPPYDAGCPAKAPADIGELVSSYYAQRCT